MGLFRRVGLEVGRGGLGVSDEGVILECTGFGEGGEEKGSKEDCGGEKSFHFVFTRNKVSGV